MTNDQINAAIAEACGWEEITDSVAPEEFQRRASGMLRDKHGNRTLNKQIPDYCNDLNAMHEAEGTLGKLLYRMESQLKRMAGAICFHASARQRAEAFLRTLDKWEEVQS